MRLTFALIAASLLGSTSAAAQDDEWEQWTMGNRLTVFAEAFFPSLDTQVRVDASDGTRGTVIDFEQNLGMSDTETLPTLYADWRFAKRHRVIIGYFSLDRSGSAVTATEIRFGDEVFSVDLPISSFLDIQTTNVGYSYSLLFDEKKELAISAGLSVMDVQFGIVGNAAPGTIEADSGLTAPLPSFGLNGGYAFTDKLFFRAGVGIFSFQLALADDDELSGEITNARVGLYHKTFNNVQFGIAYSYFDINASFVNASRFNSIDYRYQGPALSIAGIF